MPILRFEVCDDLVTALGGTPDTAAREIRFAAAVYYCRRGEMSTARAARLAGSSYAGSLEAAAQRKVDLYDYGVEETEAEVHRPPADGVDIETIKQDVARAQSGRRECLADHCPGEGGLP